MAALKVVLIIVLILVSVAITTIILSQEGKQNGLSSLSGQQFDSYYSKNKGRTKEGLLVKITTILVVLFFILSAVLNIGSF
ncbi:MAG: preprotein translocase subunit SecG [Pseudobutyrivibrio sp.]|nr:preprotein translocase subunit SecG [Pseudobutyrivibrio sp.]